MLTPAQAEAIADDLIQAEQQRRPRLSLPRPIPFVYRSSALSKLSPSRQTELFERASALVDSKRSVLFTYCGLSLLCVAPLWLLGSYLGGWFSLVVLLNIAPALAFRAYLVRRQLQTLVASVTTREVGDREV